jgi:hypothetical protein
MSALEYTELNHMGARFRVPKSWHREPIRGTPLLGLEDPQGAQVFLGVYPHSAPRDNPLFGDAPESSVPGVTYRSSHGERTGARKLTTWHARVFRSTCGWFRHYEIRAIGPSTGGSCFLDCASLDAEVDLKSFPDFERVLGEMLRGTSFAGEPTPEPILALLGTPRGKRWSWFPWA